MLVRKKITSEADIKFTGITLLSADEAKQVPEKLLETVYCWWLRSPATGEGCSSDLEYYKASVAVVERGKILEKIGKRINSQYDCSIRPALIFADGSDLNPGDELYFCGNNWTVIPGGYALMDSVILEKTDSGNFYKDTFPFRDCCINFNRVTLYDETSTKIGFDEKPNRYEDSDIKKYLEEWAERNGIEFTTKEAAAA